MRLNVVVFFFVFLKVCIIIIIIMIIESQILWFSSEMVSMRDYFELPRLNAAKV